MSSFQWLTHKNKRILYMDLVSQKPTYEEKLQEFLTVVKQLEQEIEKYPPKSILSICSVEGGVATPEITQRLKEFTKHNEPYMKMTAIIGVHGIQKVLYQGVLFFTGRKNLVLKNSKQEALDWLAEQ